MADINLLLKRASEEDFLAEDDPLAELSRLVGFDPSPVAKTAQHVQRREPAFDLEDELLRELEIYAQPAATEAKTVAAPAYSPVAAPEPDVAPVVEAAAEPEIAPEVETEAAVQPEFEVRAEPERQPVLLEAVETFTDASGEHIYERPASHPVFDLEDEILREFSAFDARRVSHADEHAVTAEVIHQDPPAIDAPTEPVTAELHDVADDRATLAAASRGRDVYESFRADDLDDAISHALAPERVEEVAAPAIPEVASNEVLVPRPEDSAVTAPGPIDEGDRADHNAKVETASDNPVEPAAAHIAATSAVADADEMPSFVEPSIEEFVEQDDALVSRDFADDIPATAVAATERVEQPVSPPAHDQAAPRQVVTDDHGLDDLLAEVEKYPVVDNTARWGVHSKPIAVEDVVKAAPPLVQDFATQDSVTQNGASRPVEAIDVAEPVVDPFIDQPESAADAAVDDGGFDIDLGEIELDLSDFDEGEISASPDLLAELADERIMTPDEPFIVPVVRSARPVDTDYSSLPFDPSQITQEDETFEAIAEMDVPEAPVVHEEEKPAPHPEYDIDLDAEMAQLFVTATAQPTTSQRAGQAGDGSISLDGAAPRNPANGLDLDDFERALEEDFRRSFAENRSSSTPDRVSLAPVYAETNPTRSRRGLVLLASAAAVILVFGGAGVYAYMSGDTKILTSSEPKVILADTEPVKVVPDDPGGKQVPNQNKAVYDRVSGDKVDRTKQESLVTSNEEPVDVVQRTLMPEALPMDDDTLAAATPTGDTIDPRLLPDEEEQDRVTTTNRVVSGVSPRKVKTMVVRPDGTLVEREVTEEDLKQQATNDAELMKIAQKAARDAATASDSQGDDIAKAIDSVPERLAANDDTAAKPADDITARIEGVKPDTTIDTAIADTTADAKAVEVPPVQPVVIEDEPAVVAEKPAVAEKPVDTATADVITSEAKPEPVVAEEKPVEVATDTKPVETVAEEPIERSIAVDETASNADAMAKIADTEVAVEDPADAPVRKVKTTKITPVPEVRPVDQPVDIVGTVTDQGTVRSKTEAKTQEVALADPVQKPADTTAQPTGSYVIQIASLPSEADAQASYSRLSAKFSGIIGGKGVDIRRAEVKNKGTYYRVRIPAGSKQEAQALCTQYKAAGGACLVSK